MTILTATPPHSHNWLYGQGHQPWAMRAPTFLRMVHKCVDLFAPGLNIQSTWIGSPHAMNTISGTAMASAHVAGLLAYFLSPAPDHDDALIISELGPDGLKRKLISIASPNLSDMPPHTVNLIAHNGGGEAPDW